MENENTSKTTQENKPRVCLELRHIKKDYYVDKQPFTAIHDLSVCFPDRGFVAILGHSGSGKTTLLNIIGGLDHYTEGDMIIDGKSTKDYKDRDWDNYRNKRIGFVFQSYNLIPHLTILQNVVMSLQLGGVPLKEREEKAKAVLEKVGLGEYLKKRPNQMSGGQMQRVAIARALVNDPDIILADEPTGALDSTTSVQVMDLIKEVGKDRCVIMVTHNRELADQYAERIIEMKDGRIVKDSDPLEPEANPEERNPRGKRSAMSFLTALGSSARNIRTKKGRTALTAIACSFGIIGVALVLATSNGFSQYVGDVEVSIASSVPISINPISYKIASFDTKSLPEEFPKDKNIKVYDTSNILTTPVYNNLTQEYFDYLNAIVDDPKCSVYGSAMSVMYNRQGLDFHFIADTPDGLRSINQYSSAGAMGSAISSVTSLPTTIIHEIYGDEDSMSSLYDTIEGRYPVEEDEMAIVVDRYNRIDFPTMRKLGFYKSDASYDMLTDEDKTFSFSDILWKSEAEPGLIQYNCYTNSSYYNLPENPDEVEGMLHTVYREGYKDISITTTGSVTDSSLEVQISGERTSLPVKGIQSPSIEEVYNHPETYKPIKMKIVGVLRPTPSSYIQLMPASLAYTPKLTKRMAADIVEGTSAYELGQVQKQNWYVPYSSNEKEDGLSLLKDVFQTMMTVMNAAGNTDDQAALTQASSVLTNNLAKCFRMHSVTGYRPNETIDTYSIGGYLSACRNLGVGFDSNVDVVNFVANMRDNGSAEYFDSSTPENIMDLIAYANSYSLITSVLIFPKSLTMKPALHDYLDKWNAQHPNNEITYSDIMEDFMGGLSTMIEVISAVLIVFASISLVVSSVMTAIITYVSVIERTKEIGVLRACGARKKDVSRLFEAECVIIGSFAGLIGIAFTVVVCFPINAILDHTFPGNNLGNVAQLNPWHGLLLIVISIALAFVSGFIPARIASKKDPVVCLRTE
ncbi:MAG: ATP-binding cassette domain-containing protein [Bacilli bacterium]|nr:ATP-binding cassette domain-containing protein [Bacilli bacterium]